MKNQRGCCLEVGVVISHLNQTLQVSFLLLESDEPLEGLAVFLLPFFNLLLVLAFSIDWDGTRVGVVIREDSSGPALVIGLESLGGVVVEDLELVFVRVAKVRRAEDEKGLAFTEEPEDSEGRRISIVSSEEGPAVLVSVTDPKAAYWAGGGLRRRNSTTLPGSPSAKR